jgi:hypothetical protein
LRKKPTIVRIPKVVTPSATANNAPKEDSAGGSTGDEGDSGDSFGSDFTNLVQIGSEIHAHIQSGHRPPDDTLVDTLTMMKSMLAQAQQ